MALEVEQRLDDAHVALVDGDVQRSLPPLVAGVLRREEGEIKFQLRRQIKRNFKVETEA